MMKRASPPRRTTKPKPVNRKRRTAEWLRTYGSEERVAWIQARPSVVSGLGPCVNAHVKTGGTGRKADARFIVPLTRSEHEQLHVWGITSFEKYWGGSLLVEAMATEVAWQEHLLNEDEQ